MNDTNPLQREQRTLGYQGFGIPLVQVHRGMTDSVDDIPRRLSEFRTLRTTWSGFLVVLDYNTVVHSKPLLHLTVNIVVEGRLPLQLITFRARSIASQLRSFNHYYASQHILTSKPWIPDLRLLWTTVPGCVSPSTMGNLLLMIVPQYVKVGYAGSNFPEHG